jgi:hypothetical protein
MRRPDNSIVNGWQNWNMTCVRRKYCYNACQIVPSATKKLLTALDKFEAWAMSQQGFLADPDYAVTKADKRAVLIVMGVQATVWQSEGYPKRMEFALCPPDVQRFCDFSFQ